MKDLLNRLYGRRPMITFGDDSPALYKKASQLSLADQPDQASTPAAPMPENYLPFGWAGLPALLR